MTRCHRCKAPITPKTRKPKRYCDACAKRVNALRSLAKKKEGRRGHWNDSACDSGYF